MLKPTQVTEEMSHHSRTIPTSIIAAVAAIPDSDYFALYCCSSSNSSNVGTITAPDGNVWSSNYNTYEIDRYSSSSEYAGCIRFKSLSCSYYYQILPKL